MKNITQKPILKRVRSRNGSDIFYTYNTWPTKEIDGVEYLSVVKHMPSNTQTQAMHYVRKDAMEYVK
jgi:hypothetical protein